MVGSLTVRADDLAVVVIDVQPGFLDGWMAGPSEPLVVRLEYLFGLATVFDLPCLATFEQPVEANGWLPERLDRYFPAHGQRHTKQTFNCCAEPPILAALAEMNRPQIAVAGCETDVCVLQSVLGMIGAGYQVFLLEDCLFSSEPHTGPAVRRMEAAGAIPSTVKTLSYELRHSVAAPGPRTTFQERFPELQLPRPEDFPDWVDPTQRG